MIRYAKSQVAHKDLHVHLCRIAWEYSAFRVNVFLLINTFLFLRDDNLNINEFENLLKSLFSFDGHPYFIQKPKINQMFSYFDADQVIHTFEYFLEIFFYFVTLEN